MSYLRHVEACNRFDPDASLPFLLGGRRVGFIRRDHAKALAGFPTVFGIDDRAIHLAETLDPPQRRTEALAEGCRSSARAPMACI